MLADLTGEGYLSGERLERKAKSWLRLLGLAFFQDETPYVLRVVCLIRGDRRDSIKADEILRVAEKVYGLPQNLWGNERAKAQADPQIWHTPEQDWIPLDQALYALFSQQPIYQQAWNKQQAEKEFNSQLPELLEMIYGGFNQ